MATLNVLAFGDEATLNRACVDCGLITGSFCDFCLAAVRLPHERWAGNQMTPLCTYCVRSPEVGGVGLLGAGRCKSVSAFLVALVLVVMVCVCISV